MFSLLLASSFIYSSPQYCLELKNDLSSAVKEEHIEQVSADAIFLRYLDTYNKDA